MPNYIPKYMFQFIFQPALWKILVFCFTIFVNTCYYLFLIIFILLVWNDNITDCSLFLSLNLFPLVIFFVFWPILLTLSLKIFQPSDTSKLCGIRIVRVLLLKLLTSDMKIMGIPVSNLIIHPLFGAIEAVSFFLNYWSFNQFRFGATE